MPRNDSPFTAGFGRTPPVLVGRPVKVADLRKALDVDAKYLGVYRQRLLDAGVIYPVKHGVIDIALPYLREYLREDGVPEALTEQARRRQAFPNPPRTGG